MQGPKIQTREQTEGRDRIKHIRRKGATAPFLFILVLICAFFFAGTSSAAEKKVRKASVQKEGAINDATVIDYFKKAQEQLRKGEIDNAIPTLLRIHDYSEDVLKTVKFFQGQYEKVANDPAVPQGEKENIIIKLKRMAQLVPKYTNLKEVSAYDLGYAYAKRGDSEKARKYLLEVLETAPFSIKQDSLWMKSKRLLLGLYNLEGEF